MPAKKHFPIILIVLAIILISGCIREGDTCPKNGETVKDQTGAAFECKDGKWSKLPAEKTSESIKELDKGLTEDYYKKTFASPTPVQTIFPEGNKSSSSPLPIQSAGKKYCGNNITEKELGEQCDPAGINLEQCPRPKYSGTCDNCKACLPAPSSKINLTATIGISGGFSSADLNIELRDWNANKNPYRYENATFQLYYTTGDYNDPCKPKLVLYKQITIPELSVNSGEWKTKELWQSPDVVIKYTGSDGKQYEAGAGAYTSPAGC